MPSPPKYRNQTLERQIADNKNQKELSLRNMTLSDQDMEIVAYYAIRQSKVIDLQKYIYYRTLFLSGYSQKF
mgnify:CR=1 FL=1